MIVLPATYSATGYSVDPVAGYQCGQYGQSECLAPQVSPSSPCPNTTPPPPQGPPHENCEGCWVGCPMHR